MRTLGITSVSAMDKTEVYFLQGIDVKVLSCFKSLRPGITVLLNAHGPDVAD